MKKTPEERRDSAREYHERRGDRKLVISSDNWVYAICPLCGNPAGHEKGTSQYCKDINCRFSRREQ